MLWVKVPVLDHLQVTDLSPESHILTIKIKERWRKEKPADKKSNKFQTVW